MALLGSDLSSGRDFAESDTMTVSLFLRFTNWSRFSSNHCMYVLYSIFRFHLAVDKPAKLNQMSFINKLSTIPERQLRWLIGTWAFSFSGCYCLSPD